MGPVAALLENFAAGQFWLTTASHPHWRWLPILDPFALRPAARAIEKMPPTVAKCRRCGAREGYFVVVGEVSERVRLRARFCQTCHPDARQLSLPFFERPHYESGLIPPRVCEDCGARRPAPLRVKGQWLCSRCRYGLTASERRALERRQKHATRIQGSR